MDLNLNNSVFVISGSSRGIGKGIAAVLLREGAFVVITGRDRVSLSNTYEEIQKDYPGKILKCAGDINKKSVLKELERLILKKWARIDGLVANAGALKPVEEWDIPDSSWEWYFNANFRVATRFVTHFVPYLYKTNGAIVVISSIAGVEDIGAPLPYSSCKAALNMYAKEMAVQMDGVVHHGLVFHDKAHDLAFATLFAG